MLNNPTYLAAVAAATILLPLKALAVDPTDSIAKHLQNTSVPVNVNNYVMAETAGQFDRILTMTGGINQLKSFRGPTPLDKQSVIRMNRDTLYSFAIVDISEGATLTLPDVGKRYMTAMVINQDHYINHVFFGGGTYKLDMDTFDTPYVLVWMRVLVDAADPQDVSEVNVIQDAMAVEAASSEPFIVPDYDTESFEALVASTLSFGPFVPNSFHMFGTKEDVGAVRHFIGTAGGWGGLPETEALYLNVDPGLPPDAYKIEVPADVPVDAFWSISLYNAKGFFEPNDRNAYNINSVTGARNDDGSMTVHLGGCEDDRVNCLPIMEGWNYTVRLYRPQQEILDGKWVFPEAVRVD